MQRFINILEKNADQIRHGDYLNTFRNVLTLSDLIASDKTKAIEGTEQEISAFYQTSHKLRDGVRYTDISVACIDMLIGLEAHRAARVLGDEEFLDFIDGSFLHYLALAGIRAIDEGQVIIDGISQTIRRKLERAENEKRESLEKYWFSHAALLESVEIVCNAVAHSQNWKSQYADGWKQLMKLANERKRDEFYKLEEALRKEGFDRKTEKVFQHGQSDWYDAHSSVFAYNPESGIVYLGTDNQKELYLGFFALLKEKTGYDTFDRKQRKLYNRSFKSQS